ncbi:acyltransferase domain-containing protein [Catenulispora yoronensis]
MVKALEHGLLPATLHVDEPSQHVDWSSGTVKLLTEAVTWPENGHPRRAGVSSFGISGTNAHLIIEQPPGVPASPDKTAEPDSPDASDQPQTPTPILLSAKSSAALRAQADRLHAFYSSAPEVSPSRLSDALATTRAGFDHRAVILGRDRAQILSALGAVAAGVSLPGVVVGQVDEPGKLAFLFSGQGSQRPGMGSGLYAAYPVFAEALDEVAAALDPHLDRPIRDLILTGAPLDETRYTQPALFALHVALHRLAASFGLVPDVLIGHSIGELSAAYVAGVWSLEDAAKLVAARGRLMQAATPGGAMIAIEATEDEITPLLNKYEGRVSLAAVNGPQAVVIAGDTDAAEEIAQRVRKNGQRVKALTVSHAFHSPHMDTVLEEFREVAATVTYRQPVLPIISNVTGTLADPDRITTPGYWTEHIRQAVRYHDGTRTLQAQGTTHYLELGPDATLSTLTRTALEDLEAVAVPALRADRPEPDTFLAALSTLHATGRDVSWVPRSAATPLPGLPTYPFEHQDFWLTSQPAPGTGGLAANQHPILTSTTTLPDTETVLYTGTLAPATHPWLADHVIGDALLVPGTAFLEMALHAAGSSGFPHVDELTLEHPLALTGPVRLLLTLGPADGSRRSVSIHSRPDDDALTWTRHAHGFATEVRPDVALPELPAAWPPGDAQAVNTEDLYPALADHGYRYGPTFQGLTAAWYDSASGAVFADVALPSGHLADASGYLLHPALLDAALHVVAMGDLLPLDSDGSYLPFTWNSVTPHGFGDVGTPVTEVRVRAVPNGTDTLTISITDTAGRLLLSVDALVFRRLTVATPQQDLFHIAWNTLPPPPPCRFRTSRFSVH